MRKMRRFLSALTVLPRLSDLRYLQRFQKHNFSSVIIHLDKNMAHFDKTTLVGHAA